MSKESIESKKTFNLGGQEYIYYAISEVEREMKEVKRMPFSLKILLENLLRHQSESNTDKEDIKAIVRSIGSKGHREEIYFRPGRVLLQDFTGVPAVADLAAMRECMDKWGGDARRINPLNRVDLVIDHSVIVDYFSSGDAFERNVELEFSRNHERYSFLKWGQRAFNNFYVVPPGTGICHQVNMEFLARVVWCGDDNVLFPDTLIGADSHTTMVNGLGVLGWGVGGIEAEAVMLGCPISMVVPEVVGVRLVGEVREGVTATDVVLTVTQALRKKGVVNKFVEFCGSGLSSLGVPDRATIANMAPEYGATCGIFPIDEKVCDYLRITGRSARQVELVEKYAKLQGMWYSLEDEEPIFNDILEVDLGEVRASLAGPKRPQDKIFLSDIPTSFQDVLKEKGVEETGKVNGVERLDHGSVVIAAITSCTNTSNPKVMVAAGLLAKKAVECNLKVKSWVKTSLAPGSQVVSDYLEKSNLQSYLDQLGFNLVGYGCTTCIGNSGGLIEEVDTEVAERNLLVSAVLSGNRNFEGRVNATVGANYLASPPLVVAYALAGNVSFDFQRQALGVDKNNKEVFLKDIWPSNEEIESVVRDSLSAESFGKIYANVQSGTKEWQSISTPQQDTYVWDDSSTYIKMPSFFEDLPVEPTASEDIKNGRILLLLADSVTTDHISPAGSFHKDTPAGNYLLERQIRPQNFNSYGSRRGNHEVMMRGTFANVRIRNEALGDKEGGFAIHIPSGKVDSVFAVASLYARENVPLVVVAGKEYGTGSSRDWAAKGTKLLGVKAVIAESFERIHRTNLVGMGVLPLLFASGVSRKSLGITGREVVSIAGIEQNLDVKSTLDATFTKEDGTSFTVSLSCAIFTQDELNYYRHGGILNFVLRSMLSDS